ncbi:MAG: RNA polymerase sigma factor [Actinomycetota bacterium]
MGGPGDESELVARARRGEVPAYEELVRRYQGIAHRTAYLITGQAAEAEDAAQAGFVKAYRALGRFDPTLPFRPWLLRIVANEARNLRRSAARRAALELAAAREPDEAAPSPEAEAAAGERREALLAAVNELGRADREVIAMRYFLELTEAEMAEVLGVAAGTVKSRLSRALGRLRNVMADVAGVERDDG